MQYFILILITSFLSYFFLKKIIFKEKAKESDYLERFKRKYKSSYNHHKKIYQRHSESLLNNPEINIKINAWDEEFELREKASIHKTRLYKFGESKMNNQIFYLDNKGGIYKLSNEKERIYV